MENLKYTYDLINDWIKNADQKAMILGSFNIAGFIYQLINIDDVLYGDIYTVILFVLSIIATLIALFFWLKVIYPRIDNNYKKSKIYFQHIANAYEKDIALGIEDLQKISPKDYEIDLASQIVINSGIAKKKYTDIQRFIWAFVVQLATILLLLISLI